MNQIKSLLFTAAILALVLPAAAQSRPRVSPHETISATIDRNRVTVTYGRPYTKDPKTGEARKVWGGVIPYGKVWRAGADESTVLITQQPIVLGQTVVPAGAYSLYCWPEESGVKLILNKQLGQWGTEYTPAQDFARIDLKKETLDKPVDQFTIAIEKNPAGGGLLKLSWENTALSVPFTVQK